MAVFISGTVLASLFYDHSVSICDQVNLPYIKHIAKNIGLSNAPGLLISVNIISERLIILDKQVELFTKVRRKFGKNHCTGSGFICHPTFVMGNVVRDFPS